MGHKEKKAAESEHKKLTMMIQCGNVFYACRKPNKVYFLYSLGKKEFTHRHTVLLTVEVAKMNERKTGGKWRKRKIFIPN